MLFSSRKASRGWTAVNVLPDRIDIAHVFRQANGRPEIESLASYRKEKPDVEALVAVRKQHGLRGCRCITALHGGDYQILAVDAPEVPRAEMKQAVRWRIKDMIDYPPDAASLDFVEVPAGRSASSRAGTLHVFCARNDLVRSRMRLFDEAKVPLKAIDVPEMALRNLAALWAPAGKAVALLDIDEGGGTLVIVADDALVSFRRIDVNAAQLAEPDGEGRPALMERIGLELQRSFDNYDRQFGAAPLTKLLVFSPRADDLVKHVSEDVYVPVEAADLSTVIDFPRIPELRNPARQAQCLTMVGIALRPEEGAA